jgi:glycosyltransferase involved in cell wall biosynthesis
MSIPSICHITTVHSYSDVRIVKKECYTLAENGYNVSLIVPSSEAIHDTKINVISIGTLPANRIRRIWCGYSRAKKEAIRINAQIIHIHDPELLFLGLILRKKGYCVIYDAHEDVPRQLYSKHYLPSYLRKTISWLAEKSENWLVQRLSGVVAATPVIANRFTRIQSNTAIVCNYPSISEFSIMSDWSCNRNQLCYVGGIFAVRGAYEMVNMLQSTPFRLSLAGTYSPSTLRDELIKLPGWDQVDEMGFVKRDKISEIMSKSFAGLVVLHPLLSYQDSFPVKMFEYMAAGIPVIASDFSLWRSIISNNNCGICCDPLNVEAIREAALYLYNNQDKAREMGNNGRKLIADKLNWEAETQTLLSFYNRIVNSWDK